ncbi:uncharacterized protein [Parasteatoda tepidariorum]|uniref:uncharacterized protein n=1 Tax=Parasteatoda tepidariorum TaxID=114398 RepID=UPI00077FA4CD|nr:uncharacterized protein LOC107451040 [Parasteatoda tepidariorum]
MDIPGYIYDHITKRYYREATGPWANVKKEVMQIEVKQTVSQMNFPKPKSMIDLLQQREYGMRKNFSIESPFLKLKTDVSFDSSKNVMAVSDQLSPSVLMIKGGQHNIFGLWKTKDKWNQIVGEVYIDSSKLDPQVDFRKAFVIGVQDFCDGYRDSELLMIASNDYMTESGRIILLHRAGGEENIQPARYHLNKSTVFSCCCNSFVRNFAVGSELSVTIENSMGRLYSRHAYGNVHSIQYNDTGDLLYCGLHNGAFSVMDLRMREEPTNLKLFDSGINECCVLGNKEEIILGSFDGVVCKFDLRMLKDREAKKDSLVVAEYLEHVHSVKKKPFSVNETLGLLCATGKDNQTRVWSLKGGLPIKIFRPPIPSDAHGAWLLNDPWNAALHIFQNKMMYVYKL